MIARATEFEFNQRFWLIGVIFWLGFTVGSVDRVNAAVFVLRLLRPSIDLGSPEATVGIQVILGSGALLVFFAAFLRTWATAYLRAEVVHDAVMHSEKHDADGPYRYVRNPLYFANILLAAGVGLMASRVGWLVLVLGMTLFMYRLILREEQGLLAAHEGSFGEYLRRVPRLFPSLAPRLRAGNQQPRWVQALLGETFVWIFGLAVLAYASTLRFKFAGIILTAGVAFYFVIALARKRYLARDGGSLG